MTENNRFAAAMTTPNATTENGAPAHLSTLDARLDLFYKSVRDSLGTYMGKFVNPKNIVICFTTKSIHGKRDGSIIIINSTNITVVCNKFTEMLRKSWDESPLDTMRIMFHVRDIHNGKGERLLFRVFLLWAINNNYINELLCNLRYIPNFGRWDDLYCLWENDSTRDALMKYFAEQLNSDMKNMHEGKSCSLLSKWLPNEKGHWNKVTDNKFVPTLLRHIGCSLKTYRRRRSQLNSYLKVVEKYMCSNTWENIDYSAVPSRAMHLLKKAFVKNDSVRFNEWKKELSKGSHHVKVNSSQVYVHELVKTYIYSKSIDEVVEAQWKEKMVAVKNIGALENCLALVDVSGSMAGTPMEVAIALGLTVSECSCAPFKNMAITFHEKPSFHIITGHTLFDRVNSLVSAQWGGTTNFNCVFRLILDRAIAYTLEDKDLPKTLYVFSDMQFNEADNGKTNLDAVRESYSNAGYTMPKIVFWNLRGNTNNSPATILDKDVAMVSGFSTSTLDAIINGNDFSPIGVMRSAIDHERYSCINI